MIAHASKGVLQGYNAQAAATASQIVVVAEVTATTNDQPHFVPIATAVIENSPTPAPPQRLARWLPTRATDAANGTTDIAGANVLIATKKSSWRRAAKPDDDKLACWPRSTEARSPNARPARCSACPTRGCAT